MKCSLCGCRETLAGEKAGLESLRRQVEAQQESLAREKKQSQAVTEKLRQKEEQLAEREAASAVSPPQDSGRLRSLEQRVSELEAQVCRLALTVVDTKPCASKGQKVSIPEPFAGLHSFALGKEDHEETERGVLHGTWSMSISRTRLKRERTEAQILPKITGCSENVPICGCFLLTLPLV